MINSTSQGWRCFKSVPSGSLAGYGLGVVRGPGGEASMVIVMDMNSGKRIEEPEERYGDEVLNANWLPSPEVQLGLQHSQAETERRAVATQDVEAFLSAVYRYQE